MFQSCCLLTDKNAALQATKCGLYSKGISIVNKASWTWRRAKAAEETKGLFQSSLSVHLMTQTTPSIFSQSLPMLHHSSPSLSADSQVTAIANKDDKERLVEVPRVSK